MTHSILDVRPVAGALGAEIFGGDLWRVDDALFTEIHGALIEHQVVIFRNQEVLAPGELKALAARFGAPYLHPYLEPVEGHPEVLRLVKEPEDKANFGGSWHADLIYLERPVMGAVLQAIEVPSQGGDTLFASACAAYEALSDGMKRMLEGLSAVNSDGRSAIFDRAKMQSMAVRNDAGAEEGTVGTSSRHPVVVTHPESGRKALYVNALATERFDGFSEDESRPLLGFLFQHIARPEFTARFRWQPGDVTIWDNRCVQHFALNDYGGQRRVMQRVIIAGERPTLRAAGNYG